MRAGVQLTIDAPGLRPNRRMLVRWGAHPVHLVMVSTGQQKDELHVAGLQHGAASSPRRRKGCFKTPVCLDLMVLSGRKKGAVPGARGRENCLRCLRWGLPLGRRSGAVTDPA